MFEFQSKFICWQDDKVHSKLTAGERVSILKVTSCKGANKKYCQNYKTDRSNLFIIHGYEIKKLPHTKKNGKTRIEGNRTQNAPNWEINVSREWDSRPPVHKQGKLSKQLSTYTIL